MANSDWARAAKDNTIVFLVANYLQELSEYPNPANLYSEAITKVPYTDQNRVLNISNLDEASKTLVKDMFKASRSTKLVRKFAKKVAKIMWDSIAFRKRLAKYWENERLMRDVELQALPNVLKPKEDRHVDDLPVETDEDRDLALSVTGRSRHLMEQMGFCERRIIDCGLEKNSHVTNNWSSQGELISSEDQDQCKDE